MKQFPVYLLIVSCLIIFAKADNAKNNWEPISKSCKKFQNIQKYNLQKCEKPILWGTAMYCNYNCNKAGVVVISECQFTSNDVDYPLCNDLYCAAGKADGNNEGSKKPLDKTQKTDEQPKETTATTAENSKTEETTGPGKTATPKQ